MAQRRKLSNKKLGVLLLIIFIIASTPFFGQVRTKFFSAYAACRWGTLNTEGYGVWVYKNTTQKVFLSDIVFFDGTNRLTCHSFGVGPFWVIGYFSETLVGCVSGVGNISNECPRGYFGVDP